MSDEGLNAAMRAAGYKRCPRWWLTDEQLELVAYLAQQNLPEVKAIKAARHAEKEDGLRQSGIKVYDTSPRPYRRSDGEGHTGARSYP